MWVVTRRRLREYWCRNPDAKAWLENWYKAASSARWRTLQDVRRTFPHADLVRVGSGKSVTVFNVCGNKHRMLTAIHYNTEKVFVLGVMDHAEYSKNRWKDTL
jgi:mRNA interferase HigB